MDAAVLDALEIGCYDLGCFDTHSVLDAAILDATVLDGTILDVVNTPYEGDFGCFLEVMNVGCCGFGCCVNWMLRSWMLQYSPILRLQWLVVSQNFCDILSIFILELLTHR